MEIIGKLNTKQIIGNVKQAANGSLYTVIGIAVRSEQKETNYGESTLFHGEFKAVRASDGAIFASAKAYFPPVVSDTLRNALVMSKGEPVEFAVEIGKKESDLSIGYEYTVKPLIDTAVNSPLDNLANRAGVKMLAAPDTAAEPAEGKASKPKGKK